MFVINKMQQEWSSVMSEIITAAVIHIVFMHKFFSQSAVFTLAVNMSKLIFPLSVLHEIHLYIQTHYSTFKLYYLNTVLHSGMQKWDIVPFLKSWFMESSLLTKKIIRSVSIVYGYQC